MRNGLLEKISKVFTDSSYRFSKMMELGMYNHLSDKEFLEKAYKALMGRSLNLLSPRAYTEKLQWLKLYDRREIYTKMVDKAQAKQYIYDVLGTDEYCIETLGVWDSVENIPFDELPNQFVLKCTHDSGGIVICKDKSKLNVDEAKRILNRGLNNKKSK